MAARWIALSIAPVSLLNIGIFMRAVLWPPPPLMVISGTKGTEGPRCADDSRSSRRTSERVRRASQGAVGAIDPQLMQWDREGGGEHGLPACCLPWPSW